MIGSERGVPAYNLGFMVSICQIMSAIGDQLIFSEKAAISPIQRHSISIEILVTSQ